MTLTDKESSLLKSIQDGMDEPGCGWLHELAPKTKETAGTLGSLIKKGLVRSTKCKEPGEHACYWVEMLEVVKG